MGYLFKRAGIGYLLWPLSVAGLFLGAWHLRHSSFHDRFVLVVLFGAINAYACYEIMRWRDDKWLVSMAAQRSLVSRILWLLSTSFERICGRLWLFVFLAFGVHPGGAANLILTILGAFAWQIISLRLLICLVLHEDSAKALPYRDFLTECFWRKKATRTPVPSGARP